MDKSCNSIRIYEEWYEVSDEYKKKLTLKEHIDIICDKEEL